MNRPSQPLRLLLALGLALAVMALLSTLLTAADSALSVWERLHRLPAWMAWAWSAVLVAVGGLAGWGLWRLLFPRPPRAPRAAPLDRTALQTRIDRLASDDAAALTARSELAELDRRRVSGVVQVALFGEISAGKSSLLRALAPQARVAVDVLGGTTTSVSRHSGTLPDGRTLEIADVPGLFEAGGEAHAALARAEAARSHGVIYVADGDLTRAQDTELRALSGYGRPLILVLNKIDRYSPAERDALLARLRERYAPLGAQVLAVGAGHTETVQRVFSDGRRESAERDVAPALGELPRALQRLTRTGAARLEAGREAATMAHIDTELAAGERAQRERESAATIAKYTRRAVVGALAAVAPGTDLIIQGALAAGLLRELCAIHHLPLRDLDIDDFLARAGSLVRTTTSITLAIAGNALKAFPGLGTVGGGLLHAVAYGLIFDSLGRAVAQTLARTSALDRDATLSAFRASLERPAAERLQSLATLALEAWGEQSPSEPSPRSGVQAP